MKTVKPTRVCIPCRISYAYVWEPKDDPNGGPAKYRVACLIDKKDEATVAKVKKAIQAAITEGKTKLANQKGIVPNNLKSPLRDADEEGKDDEAYAGMYFINASNTYKPQIVNRRVEPILDPDEVYSGCYCNVSMDFYAFNREGNKGIAASLGNIQKIKDGARLAGGASASDDFAVMDDEEDEFFANAY